MSKQRSFVFAALVALALGASGLAPASGYMVPPEPLEKSACDESTAPGSSAPKGSMSVDTTTSGRVVPRIVINTKPTSSHDDPDVSVCQKESKKTGRNQPATHTTEVNR